MLLSLWLHLFRCKTFSDIKCFQVKNFLTKTTDFRYLAITLKIFSWKQFPQFGLHWKYFMKTFSAGGVAPAGAGGVGEGVVSGCAVVWVFARRGVWRKEMWTENVLLLKKCKLFYGKQGGVSQPIKFSKCNQTPKNA